MELNIDKYPDYRRIINTELQEFIEQFITEDRKKILKKIIDKRTHRLAFVAEQLIDEHNIHAIIRTSECFGLQNFYNVPFVGNLKKNRSVTRGALQWTHIYEFTEEKESIVSCINYLKSEGYKVYATSSNFESHFTPQTVPVDSKIAIIMGNEHRGVSETALKMSDGIIEIPMYGFTESFNVSVAAALLTQPIVERIRNTSTISEMDDEYKNNLYYEWLWHSIKHPDKVFKEWMERKKI